MDFYNNFQLNKTQNMNAIITDEMYWNAHKTNKNDRRIAKDFMKALRSKDYDYPEAKIEIQKEIRYRLGFQLPEECLFLVKSYLLLPRDIYQTRLTWWNRQLSIPIVYTLEYILRISYCLVPTKTSTLQAVRILYNKIIEKNSKDFTFKVNTPEKDADIRCYTVFCGNTTDLVVKPMCYMVDEYSRVTTKKVMDRYMCKSCIKDNHHKMKCRGCDDLYTWDKLTYHPEFTDDYSWFNHKQFFCRRCVIDINKQMKC